MFVRSKELIYKMVRELKIDSTLWATPAKVINLLDFKPQELTKYLRLTLVSM